MNLEKAPKRGELKQFAREHEIKSDDQRPMARSGSTLM